jgi:hypothetical protein
MLKQTILAKRRPGMGRRDFRHQYLNEHGPLVRAAPDANRSVESYQQNLVVAEQHAERLRQPRRFDAITEIAFADIQAFRRRTSHPNYLQNLLPDALRFGDMALSHMLLSEDICLKAEDDEEKVIVLRLIRSAGNRPARQDMTAWVEAIGFADTPGLVRANIGAFANLDDTPPPFDGYQRFGFRQQFSLCHFLRIQPPMAPQADFEALTIIAERRLHW